MSQRKNRVLLLAVMLVVISALATADDLKKLTPEVSEALKSVGSVIIHPDGEMVAFTLNVPRTADETSGTRYSELYLIPFAGGEAKPLITGKQTLSSIAWSSCGKKITFLANRGNGNQLYALPVAGGEARQITSSKLGVRAYRVSPDGRYVAYLATDDFSEETLKLRKMGRDQQKVEKNFRYTRIHLLDKKEGKTTILTPADYNVWDFNWSPDSKQLVIVASDEPTTDASYMYKHLYLLDIASGQRKELCKTEGKLGTPYFSPDGSMVAWNGGVDIYDPKQGSLFVCKVAEGKAIDLTKDYVGTVSYVQWLDNNTLAMNSGEWEYNYLKTMSPAGDNVKTLLGKGPIFGTASFSKDGKRIAVGASTATHPAELYVSEAGGKLKKLTDFNPHLKDYAFGKQEVISYKTSDDQQVNGILIYPVDYKEGKKYPLVVQPHGGPEHHYSDGWNTSYGSWSQLLANEGYFVFAPNYRGSTSRGVAWAKADHLDLGGREFDDVLDGVDHLIKLGLVDKDRVGSGGGSYGGYFSALAATKASDRFAAAIVWAGITNWYSYMGTSDIPDENALVHWKLRDWYNHPEALWKGSPVAYIKNAKTPTLIGHGERDLRVPISQGQELFRNLKTKGDVPVEMVVYPRSGHGLSESQHKLDYIHRSIAWFNKYLRDK